MRALQVGDVDFALRKLLIRHGKFGKHRYVALPDEGLAFFYSVTQGRSVGDLMFREADGGAWGLNSYLRLLRLACRAAGIEPAINFHNLRHTYASLLAMHGVPLVAIARQLGHSDLRTVLQCYAHFTPSYFDELLRERFSPILRGSEPAAIYINLD